MCIIHAQVNDYYQDEFADCVLLCKVLNFILCSCSFSDNRVILGGTALAFLSRTREDIANLPTIIENW